MEHEDEILGALCILLIVAGIEQIRRQRRRRTVWVRSWLERREQLGAYHALLQELATEDPCNLKNFLRMDMESFNELLHMVEPLIQRRDTHMRNVIPLAERHALTLRFLATGESYQSLQYLYRISRSSISKILPETCQGIYKVLKDKFLKVPNTKEAWDNVAKDFEEKWNFPNCIGAIDGKHITLKCPAGSGSTYFNYKKSTVLYC